MRDVTRNPAVVEPPALNRQLLDILSLEDLEPAAERYLPHCIFSFISGAVPAVALWVPFNIAVRDQVAGAKMLVDASKYYPEAAIVSGWAADNAFIESKSDIVKKVIQTWIPANDYLVEKPDEAVQTLRGQQRNVLAYLHEAVSAHRDGLPAPKLLTTS